MSEPEPMVTVQVVVSRVIDEHGRMSVEVRTPASYNIVEILGLLDTAKMHIYHNTLRNQLE